MYQPREAKQHAHPTGHRRLSCTHGGTGQHATPNQRHPRVTVSARPNDRRELGQPASIHSSLDYLGTWQTSFGLEKWSGLRKYEKLKSTDSSFLTTDKAAFPFGLPLYKTSKEVTLNAIITRGIIDVKTSFHEFRTLVEKSS